MEENEPAPRTDLDVLVAHIDEALKQQTRTIFNRLDEDRTKLDALTAAMSRHEVCYKEMNGNGQPGLKETILAMKAWQKLVAVLATSGGVGGIASAVKLFILH